MGLPRCPIEPGKLNRQTTAILSEGMFLASNICWVNSGTWAVPSPLAENVVKRKTVILPISEPRHGQGPVLLRPAGSQRRKARHEEMQTWSRGELAVQELHSPNGTDHFSVSWQTFNTRSNLHSKPRGKGTKFTAILRRSQFNLISGSSATEVTHTPQSFTEKRHCSATEQLSREAQAAGHATHSSRDQVVQVAVRWRRQLPFVSGAERT